MIIVIIARLLKEQGPSQMITFDDGSGVRFPPCLHARNSLFFSIVLLKKYLFLNTPDITVRSDVRNPSTIDVLRFLMADSFERVFSVIFSTATLSLNHKRRRKQTPHVLVNREFIGLGCFGRVISGLLKVVYINSY